MKIHYGNNEVMETKCTGCMCHDIDMQFGEDKNICGECGCPKTIDGVNKILNDRKNNV